MGAFIAYEFGEESLGYCCRRYQGLVYRRQGCGSVEAIFTSVISSIIAWGPSKKI